MGRWHHRDGAIKHKTCFATGDHITIIGPYGNVWGDDTYPTAEAAEAALRAFWSGVQTVSFDPSEWRLAVAEVRVRAIGPSFVLPSTASAIEAATVGETGTGSTEGESAVPQADAQP